MREIKFRGKTLDNGEWVYGFLFGKVMEADDEYIALEYWVPVDPETVCLVDKEVGHEKTVCD